MIKHPDGNRMTKELTDMSGLPPGFSILDMGAGDGESVMLLRSMGYIANGVDLIPSPAITRGDMTCLPFPEESFDGVLAECSFSVCGDTPGAFSQAFRVLKPGGVLMLSDVYFKSPGAPNLSLPVSADKKGWESAAVGFVLEKFLDRSEVWTEFIIDCIWHGRDLGDCGFLKSHAKAKCGYFISIWKKSEGQHL